MKGWRGYSPLSIRLVSNLVINKRGLISPFILSKYCKNYVKYGKLNLENHIIESYRNHEFVWNYNFQLFRKDFE